MISSNTPWVSTGYGQQLLELMPYLKQDVDLAVSSYYGLQGNSTLTLDGVKFYPQIVIGGDPHGAQSLLMHGKDFKADVLMTLQDIWPLDPNILAQMKGWVPIVPIDHDPVPPAVVERLNFAYRIITYSQFGHQSIEKFGFASTYIQHTIDTKLFKPIPDAKKELKMDDKVFVFGMVAANKDHPPRKSFQEVLDAFRGFLIKHPNSRLYFHVLADQPGGFQIREYSKFLGIDKNILIVDPYQMQFKISHQDMPKIYSAMDCLLMPSTNEGFGVPAIEAQACGTPVITNDFTSMNELVIPGKTGLLTKVGWRRFSPLGSYVGHPDTKSLYDSMEEVYTWMINPKKSKKVAKAARKFIVENYDTKKVYNLKWKPFIAKLETEIIARKDFISD